MLHLYVRALATAAMGGGVILFLRSLGELRLRRLIQDTPTARIGSMAMGMVEVNGTVSAKSHVTAPFSGKPCAYWDLDIAVARKNGWSIVHRNASGHPFHVSDETGTALLYPQGANCKVRFGTSEECLGIQLPDCYAQYLSDQHLQVQGGMWRLGRMRFRERLLEEGQRVFVLGTAVPHAQAYVISDGEELATGTDGPTVTTTRAPREVSGVIRRGGNERAFVISQESERELLFDMGMHVVGGLVAGPLLTLLGIGLWIGVGPIVIP